MRYIKLNKRKKLDNRMMHGALMLTARERAVIMDMIGATRTDIYTPKGNLTKGRVVICDLYQALARQSVADES